MNTKTSKFWEKLLITTLLILGVGCADDFEFASNAFKSDYFIQLADNQQYDFLWVFDNSGSMKDKRDYVKDNMSTFLNTLNSRKAIDYQMAMVTTDFFSDVGNLVQSPGGQEVVTSGAADPVADFASIVDNVLDNPTTSFWEQGLESAYQALVNHGHKFLRNGVPLIIIFLTDEEDYSCQDQCTGVQPESNPNWIAFDTQRYIDNIPAIKANEGVDVFLFPIVGTEDSQCNVASLGNRYIEVQEAIGNGDSGSICLSDLPESYENVARFIADRGVRFPLTNQSTGTGILVLVNDVEVPYSNDNGFIYDAATNSIVFTGNAIPRNGDTIQVLYTQQSTNSES